ncbi:MAG TPA: GNAT family N-acetyltransferase [Bryobacteraceae bacterium]|nr:GNAT family N-acetyltransferase [Bryobacteraceae bacterium]
MAAAPDRYDPPLVDLRSVSAENLGPVLDEEIAAWRTELDWDLRASAELVRRFVHMQALNGFALRRGREIAGYSYHVCEDGKGLLGDVYMKREYCTEENENALIGASLDAIWRTPGIRRIEAQLMMISSPLRRSVPQQSLFRSYPRCFMDAPLSNLARLPARPAAGIAIERWQESRQDDTARLIAAAYRGHVDSLINDQYRSPGGARRFLTNIVQYPGCGTFFAPASYAAADAASGELRGISLSSLVSFDVGHITQICVANSERGKGLGYELMRHSMLALAAHGCRKVSLTVTVSNESAIRLYRQMGFTTLRDFAAYVWDLGNR